MREKGFEPSQALSHRISSLVLSLARFYKIESTCSFDQTPTLPHIKVRKF